MNPWGYWFLFCVLGVFAVLETRALITGRPTLSRTVWRATKAYPILPFVVGCCIGALAAHFFGILPACNP